jgi:hypothetical protein
MDVLAAVVMLVVGSGLFVGSMVVLARANSGVRIPFWRNPVVLPGAAVAMRAVGAVLVSLAGVWLAPTVGWVACLLVLLAFASALLVVVPHNRRVAGARSVAR